MESLSPSGAVLRNARLVDRDGLFDIALIDGRIAGIQAAIASPVQADRDWDLEGRLVVPGFVDAHMHLDKAYALESGFHIIETPASPVERQRDGSLTSAIESFYRWRSEVLPVQIYANARRAAEKALIHGTLALRTHTTVDEGVGLAWLDSLLQVKHDLASSLVIQNVAFTDSASLVDGSGKDWLKRALVAGADLIGGAPAVCADPQRAIDILFEVAGEAGCDLDLHIDESDDPASNTLEYLAQRKLDLGFNRRVTASHCCSLSAMDESTAGRVIEKVAHAGLNVVTLPSCNLYLMGRSDRGLVRRGLTRVRQLLAAGVPVSFASDNIRDSFNPFGAADMLQGALLCAHALHMGSPSELHTLLKMGTDYPARILGLSNYGLDVGDDASLVVLDDTDWGSALARLAPRRYVFFKGRLVAETAVEYKLQQE